MQFLRTLFWVLVTVVAVVFAIQNWKQVDISLSGIVVEVKLPLLLLFAFLVGLLPMLILHRATQWRMRRRIEHAERALQQIHAVETPPQEDKLLLPPGAVPSAVPPGVA